MLGSEVALLSLCCDCVLKSIKVCDRNIIKCLEI